MELDLKTLSDIDDLEIYFKIITPNKFNLGNLGNTQLKISENLIIWNLIPGKVNNIEFSFWSWNKLLIAISLTFLLIIMASLLRFYRFKMGTDLPQLPSN